MSNNNKAGGGCLILFGTAFVMFGLLALFMLNFILFQPAQQAKSWIPTPCEITEVRVNFPETVPGSKDPPFELLVSYDYQYEGKSYTGDRYWIRPKKEGDFEKLALLRREIVNSDKPQVCFVNPEQPGESMLNRDLGTSRLWLLGALLPMLIGALIIVGGIRQMRGSQKDNSGGKSPWVVGVVGFMFFCFGVGAVYPLGIRPMQLAKEAESWSEVPCEIVWSRVTTRKSSGGSRHGGKHTSSKPTYKEDIFYRYQFEGREYHSNRYGVITFSSNNRGNKNELVAKYPAGSKHVCFVNPAVPEQAVLIKKAGLGFLFVLFPVLFLVAGLILIIFYLRKR